MIAGLCYGLLLLVACNGEILSSVETSPQTLSCSDSKAALQAKRCSQVCSSATGTCFFLGYRQVSANNQDPILIRFDGASQAWCQTQIETTGDDGFGIGLLWNDETNAMYGAFTSKGTQSPGVQYQAWTAGGWIPSFFGPVASSNNVKVSVILKLDAATGVPSKGTFIGARLTSGEANQLLVSQMAFASNDEVVIAAESTFRPVDNPSSNPVRTMVCTGSSPLPAYFKFDSNLTAPIEICGTPAFASGSRCLPSGSTCPRGSISGVINATLGPGGTSGGGAGCPGQSGGNGGNGGNGGGSGTSCDSVLLSPGLILLAFIGILHLL